MSKLLRKVLLAALAICLSLGIFTACGENPETPSEPQNVTYTVNVVGSADALNGVSVVLSQDGAEKASKTPENGKAVFELPAGTYEASLRGLAEGYTYAPAVLTESAPEATINIQDPPHPQPQTVTYTVTVEGADGLSGLSVVLSQDGVTKGTAPLADGKAVFELEEGTYTVTLAGLPDGYTYESATVTADAPEATLTVSAVEPPVTTTTYTVTVACEEGTLPVGLSVQMQKGNSVVSTKSVEGGKAVFELEPDTYTVTLTGLSEGYTCESGTVTADTHEVTLTVKKVTPPEPQKVTYTVTVEGADGLTGLSVELKKGDAVADTKPVENGKAVFELEPDTYTVTLKGLSEDYTCESATVTADTHEVTLTVKKVTPPEPQTVHYTVTVECTGATLPTTVRVQLSADGAVKATKQLTDGKAEFDLEPNTYTAVLTGLPAGLEYVSETTATLTPEAPDATFTLRKKVEAVDVALTVTNTANKDLFGRDYTPAAAAGMKVELYLGEAITATVTGTTDAEGKYTFTALKLGTYKVKVNGTDAGTIEVGETTSTAAVNVNFAGGTVNAPLAFQVGENALPFTQQILETLGDESVHYTLKVDKSGLYSFDANNKNANVSGEALDLAGGLIGGAEHVAVELEADKVYTFACSSAGSADTGFDYTVTITEGNTQGGGDTPTVPWTGAGTKDSPYIITELKSEYAVQLVYDNGYTPVYFKYTETKGAKYAIYSGDENFFLTAVHADDDPLKPTGTVNRYYGGGNAASEASLFETADATAYLFALSPYDDDLAETVTVKFTIGDYAGWTSKWEGSGRFQKAQPQYSVPGIDDPYIIKTLIDTYDVMVSPAGVYFKYEATETKNYTIAATASYTLSFSVRDYNGGSPVELKAYKTVDKNPVAFTLNEGTTYLFYINLTNPDVQEEVWSLLLQFEIKEGEAVVDPEQPDGSEDHPYVLENVVGEHNDVDATSAGVWYTFTATEDADYVFALKTQGWLVVNGKDLYSASKTVTLSVKTGKSYTVCVKTFGGAATAKVSYSVTKKSNEPDGSKERPFVLEGELLGDHSIPVEKTVYYKYTLAEDMTIVVTSKGPMSLVIDGKSLVAAGAGSSQEFELKAGEIVLKFEKTGTATKAEFTVEEKKVAGPDGSEENPFPLDGEFLGKHTVATPAAPSSSYYYKTTISEDMTVIITADNPLSLFINSSMLMAYAAGTSKEYVLTKGDVIIRVDHIFWGGSPAEAQFTVAKKEVESVPLPEEFEGTWKSLDSVYEMTIDGEGALVLKKNGAAVTTVVTSATGAMEGGTFYYVTFEGKQYELKWDGVGKNALELYASTTGDVGEYIYFAPDPLPTFDLKDYAGEYTDRAGEKPNLVVSENAITWQDHTVLLVGDVTASFSGYTKAWAAYVDGKPEIVMIQNGSFYFQRAKLYFDNKAAAVELPETFVGKWKSLDGKYLLDIADTKTLTLTVSGAQQEFTLSSEKDRIETHYYLTVDGTKWELANSPAGLGTLMLASDSETVYFTPDPIPTVTFSSEIGTYTLVDYDEEEPVDGEFTISEHAITWTGHVVIVANVAQTDPDLGSSYPLFIDGNPYQLMNYGGMLMLIDTVSGTMYTLEEGAPQPQDVTYTVTVKGADKDVFGNTLNEAVKADVSVSLMKGDTAVETKTTGTDGKVTFTQPKDSYTVKIGEESYDLTDNAANITLFSDIVYGTEEHPLALKTGLTQLPFTEDILDTYNGAYFTFTPAETGTYVFTVSAETVVLVLESEDDDGSLMLSGKLSGEVTLKEKIVYSVSIGNGSPSACTLNVEKKTEGEIEGSGTQNDPEILKSLNQTITRFAGIDANGRYYFRFTADKNAILTITGQSVCSVGGLLLDNRTTSLTEGGTVSVQVQEGSTYNFWIQASQKSGPADVTIVLSTSDAPDIPWDGTGAKSSPYVLTEIGDEITVYIAAGGAVYFTYTTDTTTLLEFTLISNGFIGLMSGGPKFQTGNSSSLNSSTTRKSDTVSVSGTLTFYVQTSNGLTPPAGLVTFKIEKAVEKKDYTVTVKSADKDVYGNTINEAAKSGVDVSLMNGEQVVETKQTGADGTVTFSQPEGNYTVKINESTYTFTENAASVTLDSGVVYGTQDHPLALHLGENTIPMTQELASAGGVYYTFTPSSDATYIFDGVGANTFYNFFYDSDNPALYETVGGFAGITPVSKPLTANTAYKIVAIGLTAGDYVIKISVQAGTVEATPDEGFHFNEQFVGTWKSEDGYTISITATTFLLTEASGVKATYTISESEPDRFQERTYTIVWNSVTYTFKNLDDPITLTLSSASGSKSFELSATEGFTVDFPTEMQGSWKCQGSEDDDEDVSGVPNLVVGTNSVTWAGHDVKVIGTNGDGLTTVYILEIDGEKWGLQLSKGELNTTLELKKFKADDGYTFANAGAQGGETEDKVTYTVTVNLKDSDVFGNTLNGRLGAQVEVTLYNGEDIVETAFTDGNGVVTFTVVERDTYKVQIYGKDYDLTSQTVTVEATSDIVFGTQEHPLTLTVGANKIPLTMDVLSAVEGYVYYDLQVEVSGNYVFDFPANASVLCSQLGIQLIGSGAQQVEKELDAETVYHFTLSAGSPIDGDYGYTITITAAKPAAPWAGQGTEDEPYIIEELIGEYNDIEVVYMDEEAEFVNVYFKYTPTEDVEYYTLTLTVPGDAVITFVGAKAPVGQTIPFVNAASAANYSATIKLTKGTDLTICVSGGNDTSQNEDSQTYATFKCSFKVESYELPEPETGSAQKPDTLTELLGTHTVTTESAYYYAYTATADGKYYVSTDYAEGITFTVREELKLDSYGVPTGTKIFDLSLTEGGKDVIELTNGKTYYFTVKSNLISEGAATETFSFTIETWTAGEPDGSKANPFPLEDVFKEHTFAAVPQGGFYYTFTLEEETEIKVTALTKFFKIVISQSGKNLISKQVTGTYTGTFTAQAGEVLICVTNLMEGTADVKIKLEKVGGEEPIPPVTGGTKDNPEVMDPFTGTFTRNADYNNGWYIKFTAKESAIYTITNQSTVAVYVSFDVATATASGSANAINPNASKDFLANAGTEYIVVFSPQSTSAKVNFTMSVSSEPMPTYSWEGEGTESVPYVLTGDEDLEIYAESQKALYFKYTFTYGGTMTFTPNTNYKTRITLMGGLQWGESGNLASDFYAYTGPASDASRTLTFEAGQTVTFALGFYSSTALAKVGVKIDIEDVYVVETADYTVSVAVSDMDIFGYKRNTQRGAQMDVSLYHGEEFVETKQTDDDGKVVFTAEKKDGYTVKIGEKSYPFESEYLNVNIVSEVVWGSDAEHPLTLTTGNNNFTFTKEVFAKYSIVYFTFTPEEGADYGFIASSALLAVYKGNTAGSGDPLVGKGVSSLTAKLTLTAETLSLSAVPNVVPEGESFAYTLFIAKYVEYTVKVTTGETDVFGKEYTPTPIATGTKVTLLDEDAEVATGTTDEDGVVVLSAPEKTTYRVRIEGVEETYAVPLANQETDVTVLTVMGTQGHPLTIEAGETSVNVPVDYAETGIYYTFTPDADGVYTFSGEGEGVWFTVSGGFAEVTVGGRTHQPAVDRELTAGTAYTVKVCSLTPGTAYTVKIELDLGTDEGEENNPIELPDPFTTIEIKDITTKNRYYTFTLSEKVTIKVTLVSGSDMYYVKFNELDEKRISSSAIEVELEAGKVTMRVRSTNTLASDCSIKIEKKVEEAGGSGSGTADDPEIVTVLEGAKVISKTGGYYLQYHATESASYTVSCTASAQLQFGEVGESIKSSFLSSTKTATITVEEGKDYTIVLTIYQAKDVTFTFQKAAGDEAASDVQIVALPAELPVYGSKNH